MQRKVERMHSTSLIVYMYMYMWAYFLYYSAYVMLQKCHTAMPYSMHNSIIIIVMRMW